MVEQGNWIVGLQRIVERMQATGVVDFEMRRGDLRIKLLRDPQIQPQSVRSDGHNNDNSRDRVDLCQVVAPLTGVFYRAPNPASEPFVDVGDWLEQDTIVGLIETMKVFNEVTADCRGRVVSFLVESGELVHAGDPILLVDGTALPTEQVM